MDADENVEVCRVFKKEEFIIGRVVWELFTPGDWS